MPQSYTYYLIEGKIEDLNKICSTIKSFLQMKEESANENSDNDWGWEGNVLLALGARQNELKFKNMHGSFVFSQIDDDNNLFIGAEENYTVTEFKDVLKKLFPNLNILYYFKRPDRYDYKYETNDAKFESFPPYVAFVEVKGYQHTCNFSTKKEAYRFIAKLIGVSTKKCSQKDITSWNKKQEKDYENNLTDFEGYAYIERVELV